MLLDLLGARSIGKERAHQNLIVAFRISRRDLRKISRLMTGSRFSLVAKKVVVTSLQNQIFRLYWCRSF
jgi:hypothetical protein